MRCRITYVLNKLFKNNGDRSTVQTIYQKTLKKISKVLSKRETERYQEIFLNIDCSKRFLTFDCASISLKNFLFEDVISHYRFK